MGQFFRLLLRLVFVFVDIADSFLYHDRLPGGRDVFLVRCDLLKRHKLDIGVGRFCCALLLSRDSTCIRQLQSAFAFQLVVLTVLFQDQRLRFLFGARCHQGLLLR